MDERYDDTDKNHNPYQYAHFAKHRPLSISTAGIACVEKAKTGNALQQTCAQVVQALCVAPLNLTVVVEMDEWNCVTKRGSTMMFLKPIQP